MKLALQILLKLSLHVLTVPLAIPVVLVLRIVSPWFLVRWGGLISSRLGHFAANTELYLCERDVGINVPKKRHVDLFYMAYKPICNQQLAKMWKRVLRIWPTWILAPISFVNRLIPGGAVHEIGNNTQNDRDVHNLLGSSAPHLKFNDEEEKRGYAELKKMGIPQNAKYVCIHARGPAYLASICSIGDTYYLNYRDSDINNFVHAAESLAEQGYYVVRMGAKPEKALNVNNPKIIDYACLHRSDFMDIFMAAHCHFYIGDSCGINSIPFIFRRLVATTNIVPLEYVATWNERDLFIHKKYWLAKESRFMTYKEIFNFEQGQFLKTQQFERYGIKLIENTPEEIAALANEMVGRLNGTWQPHEDDEALQRRFWEIFPTHAVDVSQGRPLHGEIRSRIGAHFLRSNRDWLQ
jgi:putative glycosyltransferase (TIGR04372 family)